MHSWARVIVALAVVIPAGYVRSQPQQTPNAEQGARIADSPSEEFFATQVRPIFAANCYGCHSGNQPRAQLNLAEKSLALKGGISGPVIIPGNSKDSRLMHRVMGAGGEPQMPLGRTPLTPEQIAVLGRWIDEGASWPDSLASAQVPAQATHWAYIKPVRPLLPVVKDSTWSRNPIDRFILARLEKEGLKPSPEASKETLIRRVSLDLTGLPPTPAEVDAFLNDARPDAYERLVDRLLASPHYGERWATPWLDLARYGDSDGWTTDRERIAWPYRDWVIKALNQNMPFNEFTIEQLAGDLLPNATTDQKIATGFVRASMMLTENGTDPEEDIWTAQLDRTSTVGTVWLGSSIMCTQCHDHKYDPFTQKQFYQMLAFFNNIAYIKDPPNPKIEFKGFPLGEPKLQLPTPEQAQKRDAINVELEKYEKQLNNSSPQSQKRQADWEQAILAAEKAWQPLRPARLVSSNGTTLTTAPDGSILASGADPDQETYVLDAKAPLEEITGIRIEALPDASLPGGGPGRDYYGNFSLRKVSLEAGSSGQQLSRIAFKQTLMDTPPPSLADGGNQDPRFNKDKPVWSVDMSRLEGRNLTQGRSRVQLLLIPEKPLKTGSDGMLRITIVQAPEIPGANLGRFRVSITAAVNPNIVVDIPAGLRPILSITAEKRTPQQAEAVTEYYRTIAVELAPVRQKIAELRERLDDLNIPSTLILSENRSVSHPTAEIRIRGAFMSKGERVEADVPSFLGHLPAGAPPNRLGLAEWLVSRDNPLTARVTVNHYWQTIFGRGIVETAEDFGRQGSPPSHPELLDWLSTEFMDSGWNVKAIQRLMVTSSTYRQSSVITPELLERDPANVLLARGPRFRVEAEMVRDIALADSGLFSPKMYGPPVKPYQPEGVWGLFPGQTRLVKWEVSPGEDRYRRALYTYIKRSVRYPSLTVFDAPSREGCIARRPRTDTPLQALTTLNDPAFFEAGQAMARRILKEGGPDTSSRAIYGFRLATSRKPAEQELATLISAFETNGQYFQSHLDEAQALSGARDPELAAWTMFSNALLNLDETLTKE